MSLSESEKKRLKNTYGNCALITGASSGIGLELAERYAVLVVGKAFTKH